MVEGGARHADRERRGRHAARVDERLHVGADTVGRRHAHAVEAHRVRVERFDAHVLLALADGEAAGLRLDHEGRDAVGGRRIHEDGLGVARERDEALLAADDPVAALPLGARRERRRVEVPARFDERRRRRREFRTREGWQPVRLLLLGADDDERDGEEPRREQVESEGQIAVGELLEQDGTRHRRPRVAVATLCLRNHTLHEAELPAASDDLVRDAVGLVGLARLRAEDLAGEIRHGLADEVLFVGGFEAHHGRVPPPAALRFSAPRGASQAASCSTSVSSVARRSTCSRS